MHLCRYAVLEARLVPVAMGIGRIDTMEVEVQVQLPLRCVLVMIRTPSKLSQVSLPNDLETAQQLQYSMHSQNVLRAQWQSEVETREVLEHELQMLHDHVRAKVDSVYTEVLHTKLDR